MSEPEKKEQEAPSEQKEAPSSQQPEEKKWGTVMQAGATDYWAIGRSKDVREEYPNLLVPTRIKSLEGIKVAFIATGSASSHSVIGDIDGRCYVWGRNEKGQLGLGDQLNRNIPVLVDALKDVKIIGGSCGRHHTAVYTDTGDAYAMGLNSMGQCGTGHVKKVKGADDLILQPAKSQVSNVSAISTGVEFTMWLCDGKVYAAGNPEYGVMGDGSDHSYNAAESSIKMVFEPQPTPKVVQTLADKTVTRIACGYHHAIAVCSDGGVWTWGFGGYGRLGHKVQQDEHRPRLVEALTGRIQVPADAVVAAGGTSSFCTMVGGQLFTWGKLKPNADGQMYPVPYYELAGWDIKSLSCGATTFGCAASSGNEKSVITWGSSNGYNELGYGEGGKKSSANPDKCMALEGVECHQVAMGFGHSLFLVDPEDEKVKAAPVYDAKEIDDSAPTTAAAEKAGGKRKAPAAGKGGKKKK